MHCYVHHVVVIKAVGREGDWYSSCFAYAGLEHSQVNVQLWWCDGEQGFAFIVGFWLFLMKTDVLLFNDDQCVIVLSSLIDWLSVNCVGLLCNIAREKGGKERENIAVAWTIVCYQLHGIWGGGHHGGLQCSYLMAIESFYDEFYGTMSTGDIVVELGWCSWGLAPILSLMVALTSMVRCEVFWEVRGDAIGHGSCHGEGVVDGIAMWVDIGNSTGVLQVVASR